jgi:hypothetical protein
MSIMVPENNPTTTERERAREKKEEKEKCVPLCIIRRGDVLGLDTENTT